MPKVETIINQVEQKSLEYLPEVSQILDSDIDRLYEALKKQKNDRGYYAILRVVLSEVKKRLGHKDYTKPLLQISLSQLEGKPYINDLKLRICEAIIDCEEFHRINLLQHIINTLNLLNFSDPNLRLRLQIVRAGKQYFKGQYTKSANYYLNASREEILLKQEDKKIQLINKAIAFSYIAPRSNENHRIVCALCLNDLSKRSHLKEVLKKLYTEDIITKNDSEKIQAQLPQFLGKPDIDGVSAFDQARFSHNMVPIMNSFEFIKFGTLQRVLSMDMDQVLILLQKTYIEGEIKIDQEEQMIEFIAKTVEGQGRLKQLLNKIDELIQSSV